MDELTRPNAPEPMADRLRNWMAARRRPDLDDADRPLVLVGLTAVGSAALTLGLVLGWQAWHRGPAPTIDDKLPFIVNPEPEAATGPEQGERVLDSTLDDSEALPQAPRELPVQRSDVEAEPVLIIVHVSGDVLRPGVVELSADSRVHDAVALAGGVLVSADLDRVNLASPLNDGERVHIPAVGEDPPVVVTGTAGGVNGVSGASATADPITSDRFNVNTASLSDLDTLPGVGPTTARAIIATRDARGPFLSIDELVEVDGIGPTRLEALRPHLYVQGR